MNKESRIIQYEDQYLNQNSFESVMVKYRRELVMERLIKINPKIVVEVGCGAELLYQYYLQCDGKVEQWIIVEPSSVFHSIAEASGLPNLVTIKGFFEESIKQVVEKLSKAPDVIIISSVLHEVPSPLELLRAARDIMNAGSILHLNVPNATSFHRLVAKSMGIIDDVKGLSMRNVELMQYRVYDLISLCKDVGATGLVVVDNGGYFVKPFTHAQMAMITPCIGESVLDGLYQLGKDLPELASEIYVEARKP